ncbi:MAG: hypothetical protein ACLFST_13340 [Spirochaetia bacterium]
MKRALTAVLILTLFGISAGYAQEEPIPYEPDEFPQWSRDLRRAEIVAVGVFPIAFFISNLTYGIARFAINGFDSAYAPWFFAPPDAPSLTRPEKTGLLLTSIGISLTISLVDLLLKDSGQESEEDQ